MKSETYLKAAFDGITDLIFIMDKDFKITFTNKAFMEFFGVDDNEIVGKKCYEILHHRGDICEDCPGEKSIEYKDIKFLLKTFLILEPQVVLFEVC
ncbi:MAG: PAS domain S-box protein [Candidatus Helarchaeota archaeon]|nr:PAS domain S-box protein [Candidatus Helarchaeota archaeon]